MEIYLNSLLQHLILHKAYRTHKKSSSKLSQGICTV